MPYGLWADLAVLLHLGFVLFVLAGALLVLRWPRLAWLHLPAAAWAVAIELLGGICPLTYLENYWRRLSGRGGYPGGFVEQYLEPLLYPVGLTLRDQRLIGLVVLVLNLALYAVVCRRYWGRRRRSGRESHD